MTDQITQEKKRYTSTRIFVDDLELCSVKSIESDGNEIKINFDYLDLPDLTILKKAKTLKIAYPDGTQMNCNVEPLDSWSYGFSFQVLNKELSDVLTPPEDK